MATASEVAQKALHRILVEADEAELQATEYTDTYNALNHMMAEWEINGTKLGFTEVSAGTDTVTIPDACLRGVISNLAIEMAPDFGATPSAALVMQAREGKKAIRKLTQTRIRTRKPTTLPVGSGNAYQTYASDRFFGDQAEAIVSINNNTTATSFAVTATNYPIEGVWQAETSSGFDTDIKGNITNVTDRSLTLTVKATIVSTGSGTYIFALMKNGISQKTVTETAPSAATTTLTHSLTVEPGAVIQLQVQDSAGTDSLTVTSCEAKVY